MPQYLRSFVPGGTYFFTVVTEDRVPLFHDELARTILGQKFRDCHALMPFQVDAIVLLPNHFHAIVTLPPGDTRYPARIGWIKKEFTKSWLAAGGTEQEGSYSRVVDRRRGVWQRKYWEHTIRDERDFECHFDYVHYNPVKHGYVTRPVDWIHSSIHRYIRLGWFSEDWGTTDGFATKWDGIMSIGGEP